MEYDTVESERTDKPGPTHLQFDPRRTAPVPRQKDHSPTTRIPNASAACTSVSNLPSQHPQRFSKQLNSLICFDPTFPDAHRPMRLPIFRADAQLDPKRQLCVVIVLHPAWLITTIHAALPPLTSTLFNSDHGPATKFSFGAPSITSPSLSLERNPTIAATSSHANKYSVRQPFGAPPLRIRGPLLQRGSPVGADRVIKPNFINITPLGSAESRASPAAGQNSQSRSSAQNNSVLVLQAAESTVNSDSVPWT